MYPYFLTFKADNYIKKNDEHLIVLPAGDAIQNRQCQQTVKTGASRKPTGEALG